MKYKKRRKYKYTMLRWEGYMTEIEPTEPGKWGPLEISETGVLTIHPGYAWDGASSVAIDTRNFMRGSLVHDALYQLMREGKIAQDQRKRADQILRAICLQDGMSKIRAWWVYRAVRIGAVKSAKPDLLTAP
jgi:hypothetical protein